MRVDAAMTQSVITVSPETSIKDAARLLVSCGISALPVVGRNGALVGIVSEADLLRLETRPDPRAQAAPIPPTANTTPMAVAAVMTTRVVTVRPEEDTADAARLMIDAGVKRLPVVEGGKLVGIISRRDLIRVIGRADDELLAELQTRLNELPVRVPPDAVMVVRGIAAIGMGGSPKDRRLVESVALEVPGILEVRFTR